MTIIKRSAKVPHTASEMYQLVNQIEDYPKFIPWCHSTEVLSRNEDEIQATLHFEGGGLRKSFTTCNRLQKDKMIEMRLVHGPFHHLEGFWRFDQQEDGCVVMLDMEFELANKLFSMAFGPVFNQVANTLVDAFCKRANEIYPK